MYCSINTPPRQGMIEAKVVSLRNRDLSLLGRLFKTGGDAVEKKDLVVFVTPRILVDPGD
ncbi:MAG TPA: hypothetical protein VM695_08945 [Phycisphaerae bacterium]|nr:hypothetical protein [Phycisphaerae bacterium]